MVTYDRSSLSTAGQIFKGLFRRLSRQIPTVYKIQIEHESNRRGQHTQHIPFICNITPSASFLWEF